MDKPSSYCAYVATLPEGNVHRIYHDTQYGFPIHSDDELFGRLILEINQAGLSWSTILNKQDNFRTAFSDFSIQQIAQYGQDDIDRLLSDPGIIRNRLKIDAVIHNAGRVIELQHEFGSFKHWLDTQHPLSKEQWVKLFKKTFKFTGGEITNEFLMSSGYLKGAHIESCGVLPQILDCAPPWTQV
ncbi:MAG: DNA-3-methyladenine glycosylase I [Saprospiraceae bacterium]|nr:DNA-3-methyladenine glycosylase I [Lewinellaceae bacterium]